MSSNAVLQDYLDLLERLSVEAARQRKAILDRQTAALNASTQRKGTIAVGTPVSVRYHDDGSTHVATAITAQNEKKPAAKK